MALSFHKVIKKIAVWLAALLAAIVFLGLFAFGILASIFYEGSNNGQLQSWINQSFNTSVEFQSAKITWQEFYPGIVLNNIQIAANQQNQAPPAIVLSRAEIDIDLIKSIWNLRPVAHAIILQGLQLNVVQAQNHQYYLAGFSSKQGGSFSWQKVWPWLKAQEKIELLQSQLSITQLDQSQIKLSNVSIVWQKVGVDQYQLASDVDMAGSSSNHVEFKAVFSGNLADENSFVANFYGDLKSKDFAPLLKHYAVYQMNLLSAGGEVQFWGNWQGNNLQRLHAIFGLNNIELSNTEQGVKLDYFNENVLWQRQAGGWQLLMQRQSVPGLNQDDDNDNHIYISFSPQGKLENWVVECSSVNIEMLSSLLQFWKEAPPQLMNALSQLNPQGQLLNTNADWSISNNKLQTYSFNGSIQNFSMNSWGKIPGFSGLSANFHITPTAGTLQLSGQQAVLSPNYWFNQGWPPAEFNANLNWQEISSGWKITISQLSLHNSWLDFNGQGQVLLPVANYKNAQIQFLAGFALSNAQEVIANYVPEHGISEALSVWLQSAFISVPSVKGSWVWRGNLLDMPYANQQGQFEIAANAQQVSLVPWPQWPSISGINASLVFDGSSFALSSKSANSLGAQLSNIALTVSGVGKKGPKKLLVEGDVNTTGPELKSYFQSSPLVQTLGVELDNLHLNGPLSGHLRLLFPFSSGQHANISGNVNFSNNQLILAHAPWIIDNIQGSFSFSPTALHSEGLTATFLGDPLQVTMSSSNEKGIISQHIDMHGILNFDAMNQLAPTASFKWWELITGNTPFNFKVVMSSKKLYMIFNSSLKGIAINLPAPFNKANNSDLPLKVEVQAKLGSLDVPVRLSLGRRLSGYLLWVSNHQILNFSKGLITINPQSTKLTLPKSPGLLINGTIAYVTVEDWVNSFKPLFPYSSTVSTGPSVVSANTFPWFNAVNLNVSYLNIYGQLFNDLNINLSHPKQDWQIAVNGAQAQGTIDLPQNWQQPVYVAHFKHLSLASSNTEQTQQPQQQASSSKLSANYLSKLPGLSVVIDQFTLQQQSLGSIKLETNPLPNGVNINTLDIENQDISALIKGRIIGQGKQDQVSLQGNLNGKNWGNALTSFGYPGFMQDGSGSIDFQLGWLGSVTQPNLPSIAGKVDFNLKNGGLSKLNPGVIRLLGLFSLDSLIRHLSLNFSDMTDKGLAFDTITGDYVIANSIASTQNFRLTGPSLDLILEGQVNLAEQTLNQTVTVIPHVGGGLALAATLIGGPVAGAATWVADKVISSTLLKDKGIVYLVTGTWDKPVVTSAS